MTSSTNPHENAARKSTEEVKYSFMRTGTVTSAFQTTDDIYAVTVQESGVLADTTIPVIPNVHGDFYVPPEGAPVSMLPVNKNQYAVVGAPIPVTETPTLEPGERVISHPVSGANVRFNADGSLDIKGDATVRINGGGQGVITDVQAASTNDAGGITALDITRDNNILI